MTKPTKPSKNLITFARQLEAFVKKPNEKTWSAIKELHKEDCQIYREAEYCQECPWSRLKEDCLSAELAKGLTLADRHVKAIEQLTTLRSRYLL